MQVFVDSLREAEWPSSENVIHRTVDSKVQKSQPGSPFHDAWQGAFKHTVSSKCWCRQYSDIQIKQCLWLEITGSSASNYLKKAEAMRHWTVPVSFFTFPRKFIWIYSNFFYSFLSLGRTVCSSKMICILPPSSTLPWLILQGFLHTAFFHQ